MKKINFSAIPVYKDIAKTQKGIINAKEDFANVIYNNGSGVEALSLALKIYNSEGEEEYNDRECEIIRSLAEKCIPSFIDAVNTLLNDNTKEEKEE